MQARSTAAPLKSVNSFLIFLALVAGVAHVEPRIGTPALVLLALVTFYGTLHTVPDTLSRHWPWILGLFALAAVHIGAGVIQGAPLQYFDTPIRPILAALIFFYLARTGFHEQWVWAAIGLTALIGASIGFYEVLGQGASRASAGRNPNIYGPMMAMLTLLATWRAIKTDRLLERWLLGFCAALALLGVLFSGSRGAWLALMALVPYMIWQLPTKRLRRSGLLVFIIITGIAIWIGQDQVGQRWERSLSEVQSIASADLSGSMGQRLQMWHVGLHLAADRPLAGVGIDYQSRIESARPILEEFGYSARVIEDFGHLHNWYLDQMVKYGILGVFAVVLFLYGAVARLNPEMRAPCVLVASAVGISGLVDTQMEIGRVFWFALLLLCVFRLTAGRAVATDQPG